MTSLRHTQTELRQCAVGVHVHMVRAYLSRCCDLCWIHPQYSEKIINIFICIFNFRKLTLTPVADESENNRSSSLNRFLWLEELEPPLEDKYPSQP